MRMIMLSIAQTKSIRKSPAAVLFTESPPSRPADVYFGRACRQLDQIRSSRRHSVMLGSMNLKEIVMCLEDLINYFAQPDAEMRQSRSDLTY